MAGDLEPFHEDALGLSDHVAGFERSLQEFLAGRGKSERSVRGEQRPRVHPVIAERVWVHGVDVQRPDDIAMGGEIEGQRSGHAEIERPTGEGRPAGFVPQIVDANDFDVIGNSLQARTFAGVVVDLVDLPDEVTRGNGRTHRAPIGKG